MSVFCCLLHIIYYSRSYFVDSVQYVNKQFCSQKFIITLCKVSADVSYNQLKCMSLSITQQDREGCYMWFTDNIRLFHNINRCLDSDNVHCRHWYSHVYHSMAAFFPPNISFGAHNSNNDASRLPILSKLFILQQSI